MRNYKKLISLFAAVAMTVTGMPVTAMAAPKEMVNIEEAPAGGYSYLDGYTKKWGDEFDGNTLDPTVWNVELHDKGWVNSELQAYVNSEENIQVKDGRLNLIPVRKSSKDIKTSEILKNKDFSDEKAGWIETIANWGAPAWKADASSSVADGAITYTINNPGEDLWQVQLKQLLTLKAGAKYKATYKITSSLDRKIESGIQHNGGDDGDNSGDYSPYAENKDTFEAGVETPVELTFDADSNDNYVSFFISMGQKIDQTANPEKVYKAHTIRISDISIVEMPGKLTKGSEVLENGDFSDDLNGWFKDILGTTTISVSENAVTYSIAETEDKNSWDNQLFQTVELAKDTKYQLTFKAKSTIDRNIDVKAQHYNDAEENGYAKNKEHAGKKVSLKAGEEQNISLDIDFTGKVTDEHANICVQMGNYQNEWDDPKVTYGAHDIVLSDFSLKVTDVPSGEEEEEKFTYTSGRINTQNKQTFKYGLFEVKAKVPTGMGYLPAFWLMPNDENTYGQWPRCGEIDCMEVMGQETDKVYGTIHYGNPHNQKQGTAKAEGKDFAEDYHVYACEWLPGEIIWYVDGKEYYRTSNWFSATEGQGTVTYPAPFDQEFYVILNLAIGGEWVGYPNESTEYGEDHAFSVDYVRVYQKNEYDEDVEEPVKEEVTLREPDENGNYIINGDFAVKEDLVEEKDWVFKTAQNGAASAEIKDKSIAINTTAKGDVDYSVQLYQANIPLEKGSTYEVTFDAKATNERTMNVDVKAPDRSYKAYMDTYNPGLTKEFKSFRTEFVMPDETDANGRLEFNMGAVDTEDITIKNVAVKKVAGPEEDEEEEEIKTVLADGNYIYNGKFQEGKKYLGYWDITKDEETKVTVTGLDTGRKLEVVLPKNPDEDFILGQDGLAFVSGKDYSVSLSASADKDATLEVSIGGKTKIIPLKANDKFKPYTYKIASTAKFANNDLRIRIKSADEVTVYLDNISMTEDKILKNGDFNDGFTGFEHYKEGEANYSYVVDSLTENNAADFTINNTGEKDYYIQLIQYVKLEKDKTYKLSYDAKSSIERDIFVQVQHDAYNHCLPTRSSDDYINYAGTSAETVNNTWKHFEHTFTMPETNEWSKFNVGLGAVNGKQIIAQHRVLLDNISIVEVGGSGEGEGGSGEGEPAEADKIVEIPDMVYTGSQVKPAVTVYDGDILLTPKKDYTVKYYNNINVNTERKGDTFNDKLPYVEVTLKGNYEGELKANFNINRFAIANSAGVATKGTVLSAIDQLATSNKDQSVFKSLKVNKKALKTGENGDIDIALFDKDNNKMDAAKVSANGIGEYTLKVRGKGNYSGTIVKKIVVAEKGKLLKNAKITIGKNEKKKDYTGKLITLKPGYYDKENRKYYEVIDDKGTLSANACDAKDVFIVNAGGESLIYGKDYTVKYTNNLAVGKKATLVIEGKGEYYGTKSVNFEIKGRPFNKNTVSINAIADQDYTGDEIKPIVRAYYKQQGGNKPLYSGNHYTVKFLKNINKGKATIILTGKASGGYTGTVKATFKINGLKLDNLVNETVSNNEVIFTKGGINLPTDVVVLKNKDAELEAGKDFVVKKCVNNKKPANYDADKAPTATIVLKGNYTGTFDVTYTILPADINKESVSINAVAVAYKDNATKPYAPKVTVKDGKKSLAKGTDYTISYVNCAADEVKAYIEKKSDKAPKAIISGNSINGYVGTKEIPLQIFVNKMTAKNTILVIAPAVYSDKQVKPAVKVYFSDDRTVINAAKAAIADGKADTLDSMEGLTKVAASNYSVSYGKNNVAGKNKGSVTINGTSCEYSGTVSAKFDIKEKSI